MINFVMEFNQEVKKTTDPIYQKISKVMPEIEWSVHAPYIYKINKLKKEKNAVILAHNYQTPEIYHGIADFSADSLALAVEASKTSANIIVMAGVHFMAETAKLMSPNKKVLLPDMKAGCSLSSSITGKDVRLLKEKYRVHRLWEVSETEEFIKNQCQGARAMVTDHFGANEQLIQQFPKLKCITNFGVGFDAVAVDYASKKGIQVTNTPDVLTDDVADLAIGLLLSVARSIPEGDRFVREGTWSERSMRLTQSITGKKIGILGMGRIGQAIAKRAEAFRLHVSYHGPREKPGLVYPYYSKLEELAKNSDFLVVSCPGGEATRKIVSQKVMESLGSEGILVNIARGSVIDEAAMVELLQNGKLGAAGLDVFENEPNVPETLLSMDKVVLLSLIHISEPTRRYAIC